MVLILILAMAGIAAPSLSWAACEYNNWIGNAGGWTGCSYQQTMDGCNAWWKPANAAYGGVCCDVPAEKKVSGKYGSCSGGANMSRSYVDPTCTPPQVLQNHVCVSPPPPTCEENQYVDTATNTCVDNPTCAAGQHVDSTTHLCVPDTPQPEVGSPAPEIGIPMGTCDAWGNCDYHDDPNFQIIRGGGKLIYNCGGWECEVSAVDYADSCTSPIEGGTQVCNFIPKYTGNPAGPSSPTAAPNPGGPSYAPTPSVGCPAGYVLNAYGVCVSGQSDPTPSTPTAPGSTGSPGSGACPTGYVLNPDGTCSGGPVQSPGGTSSCPVGYTLTDGVCKSIGTIGPGGVPYSGTPTGTGSGGGTCGGQGQPPCAITGALTGAYPAATGLYTGSGKTVAGVFSSFKTGIESTPFYSGAVGFFDVSIPGGSCSGLNGVVHYQGQSFAIDLEEVFCSQAAQAMYGLMAIAVLLGATWAAYRIALL